MKNQTLKTKQVSIADLMPVSLSADTTKPKAKRKAKVQPPIVHSFEQGNCDLHMPQVKHDYLSLVGLPHITSAPLPTNELQLKANHIDKVKPSHATISNGLTLNTKPQTSVKTPQTKATSTKFNAYGNSKGYGDKWPTEGTSAAAIWAALVQHKYSTGSVTKIWVEKLAALNLQCDKGRVNDNNLSIEINSFKRYLINHNLSQAPAKAA